MALGLVAVLATGFVPRLPSVLAAAPVAPAPAESAPGPTVVTERIDGSDRFGVAVTAANRLFAAGWGSTVFLVPAAPDATSAAAAAAASRVGAAVLYSDPQALRRTVAEVLTRLEPTRVTIVGTTTQISKTVETQVTGMLGPGVDLERISGLTPADTAATLSSTADPPVDTVFVAASDSLFDAVPAAAAAAALHAPLLLSDRSSLPAATANEIGRLSPTRIVVVGSPTAVSDDVLTRLRAIVPNVQRVYGADRYATAANLARLLFPESGTVLTSLGSGEFGAIASIPLAAAQAAPLLFTQAGDQLPDSTRDALIALKPAHLLLAGPATELIRGELVGFSDGRITVPTEQAHYPTWDPGWHDPGEMETIIKATEVAYPDLVRVFSIGKSAEGRDIWAAKVSDNVSVDENEPEVMIDALHHAAEHLSVEQALYLLNTLTADYATDPQVKRLVDSREIWIIFAVNPDGWAYDISGNTYHYWRRSRQHNDNNPNLGVDLNRNYGYMWNCCSGSDDRVWAWNYHGPAAFSAPETRAIRDFVASRVVGGVQQIKTHVTLHTDGELVLFPWAYTYGRKSMDPTDFDVFRTMARKMASLNGYTAEQSSVLYPTDGDEMDWMYAAHRIFSFTLELYPTEQAAGTRGIVYPPASVIAKQTARNRAALLYLIDMAGCPYAAVGLQARCA